MKKFLLLFLLLISALFISCSHKTTQVTNDVVIPSIQPILRKDFNTALYQTQIDIKERHFSGLFYFKNMPDTSTRIVFLSEMGMGFFEFEYKNREFKVISCQDFFDKKIILKTLQNDLRLLIDLPKDSIVSPFILAHSMDGNLTYELVGKSESYLYTINKENAIVFIQEKRKKIQVLEYEGNTPKQIQIEHTKFPLKLEFNLVNVK